MKKKVIITFISCLLCINLAEILIETNLNKKNIIKNFKLKNSLINYSFTKFQDKGTGGIKILSKTFFKLYPKLSFLIIKNNNQIAFVANKNPSYNKILTGVLNTFKTKNKFKKHFSIKYKKNDYFHFNSSKIDNMDIITGFKYHHNNWGVILRNIIISLFILAGFTLLIFKQNKPDFQVNPSEPSMEKHEEEGEKNKSFDKQQEIYNSQFKNYKNLYEDNQKLIEELENLTTFREVGLAINSILNFNQMLHVIMGVVMGKMGVQKIKIYFIDEDNKELISKIERNGNKIIPEDALDNGKIILGVGNEGRAMEFHSPLISSDNIEEPFLICPLMTQGTLIGAIKVSSKLDTNIFHEKDKETLKLLSSQIAIALNNARLYEMAITDGLTKLYVHRHFQYRIQEENLRHKRNGKPLSLIMLDIDHFKNFNDNNGHQTGDYILREMAKIIKHTFRVTDATFRYGGEEMAVILPETNSDAAYVLAEKLRNRIKDHLFQHNENELKVTISLGVSTYYPQKMGAISKENLISMADEALYHSKNNGRNCTTVYSSIIKTQYAPSLYTPMQESAIN